MGTTPCFPIFTKENDFCDFLFYFSGLKSPSKGFSMEGKNLLSNGANSFLSSGSKFFPLKGVDPHFGRGLK